MYFGRIKPLGLRTRLTLWSSVVLAASLVAGLVWVHDGLRRVLATRNDAFLSQTAVELLASADEQGELEAEIHREVLAYAPERLIVVVRRPTGVSVDPDTDAARRLAALRLPPGSAITARLGEKGDRYRVLAVRGNGLTLEVGISVAATEATLAAFDRQVGGGALAFLLLAAIGGLFLSRQALRPVAASIRTARRLDPESLSERLPLTGAGDELDELAGTINGLLDRLAAYHAQSIRFTADASHELRSPLSAMRAAIEVVLQKPRGDEEYRSTLASLGEQCDRLTSLVNGLLLLARADAGVVAIAREPVDVASIAREVAELFDPVAEEEGVDLVTELTEPVTITGDASRLRQLVTNLLDNALRFTGRGGSVAVRVGQGAGLATIQVCDTGPGIPSEHLPHVFERFYQADAARASGGCGLGLSICRWIARAHGGTIGVTSADGKGTEFLVELPVGQGEGASVHVTAAGV